MSHRRKTQHEVNVDCWQETTAWFMDGPGRLIKRVKSEKLSFIPNFQADLDNTNTKNCDISVISEDSFSAALALKKEGYNPLVLNMANAYNPGGGVYKGSMAQEEDLFRRSNYFRSTSLQEFYPLGELEIIYTPDVAVYMKPDFTLLPELEMLSCIACAAEKDPKTVANPIDPDNPYNRLYADDHISEITKNRIETIFQIGIRKNHDSLVLGGLGCGAFNNPQMRIIEYYNENLQKYSKYFKKIVFAILSKKDPNFDLFSEYISYPDKPKQNLRPRRTLPTLRPRIYSTVQIETTSTSIMDNIDNFDAFDLFDQKEETEQKEQMEQKEDKEQTEQKEEKEPRIEE